MQMRYKFIKSIGAYKISLIYCYIASLVAVVILDFLPEVVALWVYGCLVEAIVSIKQWESMGPDAFDGRICEE